MDRLEWHTYTGAQSLTHTHTYTYTYTHTHTHGLSTVCCLFVCLSVRLCLCLLIHLHFPVLTWWFQLENLTSHSALLSKSSLIGMLCSWNSPLPAKRLVSPFLKSHSCEFLSLVGYYQAWIIFWRLMICPNQQWEAVMMSVCLLLCALCFCKIVRVCLCVCVHACLHLIRLY